MYTASNFEPTYTNLTAWTPQPQNNLMLQGRASPSIATSLPQRATFNAAPHCWNPGIREATLPQNSAEVNIQNQSSSGSILYQQTSDYCSYNLGNQNTNTENDLDMVLEIVQREENYSESHLSCTRAQNSRPPFSFRTAPYDLQNTATLFRRHSSSFSTNPSTPPSYPQGPAVLTRRRRSSGFSMNSRCETPGFYSEPSSPGEDYESNVEDLPRFSDILDTIFASGLPHSVPEILGVQNSQSYEDNSNPINANCDPLPPYHYPHITETGNIAHNRPPPPSYSMISRSKETGTEALIRIYGQQPKPDEDSTTTVDKKIHLWHFLIQLLADRANSSIICWEGDDGEFKILNPEAVAAKWGQKKGKKNMNYDTFSRAIRYYYQRNLMVKIPNRKFAYKFLLEGLLDSQTPKMSDSEFIQQHL